MSEREKLVRALLHMAEAARSAAIEWRKLHAALDRATIDTTAPPLPSYELERALKRLPGIRWQQSTAYGWHRLLK